MARLARAEVFAPDEIAIVHVMNRVVRRCFLLGNDPVTGNDYDHRKTWIEEQLRRMAGCFGIDLLCFAILSNHFHLILRSGPDVIATWDDTEVARRSLRLCAVRKDCEGLAEEPNETELDSIRYDPGLGVDSSADLADSSRTSPVARKPSTPLAAGSANIGSTCRKELEYFCRSHSHAMSQLVLPANLSIACTPCERGRPRTTRFSRRELSDRPKQTTLNSRRANCSDRRTLVVGERCAFQPDLASRHAVCDQRKVQCPQPELAPVAGGTIIVIGIGTLINDGPDA
jgi:hypothetical protein